MGIKPKIVLRSNNTARVLYRNASGLNSFVVIPSQTPNDESQRVHPVDMALDLLANHGVIPRTRPSRLMPEHPFLSKARAL